MTLSLAKRKLKKRITFWFVLIIFFMSIVSYAIYKSIRHLIDQSEWVSHTHEVLTEIQDVLSQLKDVQASQRGYVITGNLSYLDPYEVAKPLLNQSLERLMALVMDSPTQIERAEMLKAEAEKRILIAREIIETYDKQGEKAAVAKIKNGLGKREMDEARRIAVEMEHQERMLLQARREGAHQAITITLIICALGLTSCFILLTIVFNIMRKEIIQRIEMQDNLEQLNEYVMLVNKLGELLQSCQNLAEAASILKEYVSRLFIQTQGMITLVNNSRNLFETMLHWGLDASNFPSDFAPEECWSLRSGKPHLIDKNHLNPICPHIKHPSLSSFCVPMMAHGETIGMFYIACDKREIFDENFQNKVKTVTEQCALAISNLKLQDMLRIQSIKDPLTLLFNRRYMEVTLEREISRAKRHKHSIGIIMIDLDHFKRINDSYGHEAGDLVLKEFGLLVKKLVRTEDIACRYGGEEFIVILPNIEKSMVIERAEVLRDAITQLTIPYRHQVLGPFTLSAGVSVFPEHGDKPELLITAADNAVYKAKETRDAVIVAES